MIMDYNDEYFESKGYRKVFIERFNTFGWEYDMVKDIDYSKHYNIQFLEKCLRINQENEDYEECDIIKKRIEKFVPCIFWSNIRHLLEHHLYF